MARSTLLAVLSLAASVLAQNPPISKSDTFVLYPYITSGTLTGPYSNANVDKSQPLRPTSGHDSGSWTSDCFNRILLTNYVPTHCYGQDQCGYQRWSLNQTYPDEGEEGQTLVGSLSSSMLIDTESGDVGWTSRDCGNEPKMAGFGIQANGDGILYLGYENQEDEFGTFYACWVEGDIYGPRVFYRDSEGVTPEGCAEVLLVPRCVVNETSPAQEPVMSQCYLGGLPE